jgi:hypothetical protein
MAPHHWRTAPQGATPRGFLLLGADPCARSRAQRSNMTARFPSSSPPSVRSLLPAPTLNDPDTPLWASLYPVQQSPFEKAAWALVPAWFARPASGIWPAHAPARRPHWAWAVAALTSVLVCGAIHLGWAAPALRTGAKLVRGGTELVQASLSSTPLPEMSPGAAQPAPDGTSAVWAPATTLTPSPSTTAAGSPPSPAPAGIVSERALSTPAPAVKSKTTRKKSGSSGRRSSHRGSRGSNSRTVPAVVRPTF